MFELFDEIYSEKVASGHYRIFTTDGRFTVFVKVNTCISRPVMARLVRNIAREINEIKQTLKAGQ